jgi:hypothetical protein
MRNAVLAVVAVLVSIPAHAQKPGDTIFVTDRTGLQTDGVLLRTGADGLTLLVDGRERLIPAESAGRIEKRDSRWNGMLIGAAPGVLIGMMGAGASCSPHCGRDVPLAALLNGAIGAGIGALIDSQIDGYSTISGPSLSPPNARRTPPPVGSLDQLWLRVREGDRIEVATSRGEKVRGRFVQASNASVTVTASGDVREIPSSEVRRVTRSGNRYRSGALWGAGVVGTLGAVASASCSATSDQCGNPLLVGLVFGGTGALWGTMIGALIPKHPVVFGTDSSPGVRVTPLVQVGRVGVALSTRF